jgi:Cu2+-exporting ATPase
VGVLTLAAAGFLLWLPKGFLPAMNVAAALLVVTCPCAIGLSLPLAYELTLSRLRREGFFARSQDLLDRLTQVKKLVFDKTGTLTLGRLKLTRPEELAALDAPTRDLAYNLAVRSSHPVSSLVAKALGERGARYDASAQVVEVHGKGMEWQREGVLWRLGRSEWASPLAAPRRTVLAKDGIELASFPTEEVLRPDAKAELSALAAKGYEVWLLSGDSTERVAALAKTLAIPPERALGQLRPEDKAVEVQRLDRQDTLYLGDGVNDALAFERALAAGTPAIDRPVMPGRSAFFLVGEGLSQIKAALARSEHLRVVVRRVLTVSLAYNVFAVASCLLGRMSPVTAAISMPLSTLTLLTITVASLKDRPNSKVVAEGR